MLRDIYNGLVFIMFISLSISAESTLASFQEALLKHVPNLLPGDFICYNSKGWVPCQVMHFCALHYYYLIILALTMVTVVFLVTAMAGNDPSARSGWKIPVNWRWNQSGLSCQSNQILLRYMWLPYILHDCAQLSRPCEFYLRPTDCKYFPLIPGFHLCY